MTAQHNLSRAQFGPAVQRLKDVKDAMPPVLSYDRTGTHLGPDHGERLGLIRSYAHSAAPADDLRGLRAIETRSPHINEGAAAQFEGSPTQTGGKTGIIASPRSYSGTMTNDDAQVELLHEVGHHVRAKKAGPKVSGNDSIGQSEAMADDYMQTNVRPVHHPGAQPTSGYAHRIQKGYAIPGWSSNDVWTYKKTRERNLMP